VSLTPGKKYYWRVRACDAIGCGTWSDWWWFKVSSTATFEPDLTPHVAETDQRPWYQDNWFFEALVAIVERFQ
jgi:hypothetical protein